MGERKTGQKTEWKKGVNCVWKLVSFPLYLLFAIITVEWIVSEWACLELNHIFRSKMMLKMSEVRFEWYGNKFLDESFSHSSRLSYTESHSRVCLINCPKWYKVNMFIPWCCGISIRESQSAVCIQANIWIRFFRAQQKKLVQWLHGLQSVQHIRNVHAESVLLSKMLPCVLLRQPLNRCAETQSAPLFIPNITKFPCYRVHSMLCMTW